MSGGEASSGNEIEYGTDLSIATISTTNSVWHYFGFLQRSGNVIDKTHKYCNECLQSKKIFRYGLKTSNGNHRIHLKISHNIELSSTVVEKNQRKVSAMFSNSSSSLTTTVVKDKRFMLARQMALWFCRDLEDFNTANKDGFTEFAKWTGIIKSDEKLPDRNTISRASLEDVYTVVYKNVSSKLQHSLPDVLPISLDFWTDNAKRMSYLSYWVYWIDSDFVMNKVCLRTFSFPHPHTGEAIAKSFEDLKREFKFENKTFYATTDSGKNIVKACRILNLVREPCLCHNIHLLVATDLLKNKEMKPVRDLITRMKHVIKTLKYSYQQLKQIHDDEYNKRLYDVLQNLERISEILDVGDVEISDFDIEEEDVEMMRTFLDDNTRKNNEFTSLKNSNSTRWNSVLTMFRSFEKNIDVINRCLELKKNYDDIFSDDDLKLCTDFIKVLEVFEKATDLLQGDYPTMNLTLIVYVDIKKRLQEILRDKTSSELVKKAVVFLLQRISHRFPISKNMVLASYMDPSLNHLQIIQQYLDGEMITMDELLRDKCEEFGISTLPSAAVQEKSVPTSINSSTKQPTTKQPTTKPSTRLRMALIQKHSSADSPMSFQDCLTAEFRKYDAINVAVEDPLEWWKANKNEFPILSQLARISLSLMASSCVTERHFSKCGILMTKRKARLDPLHLQTIMFVHENFKFYS